MHEIDCAHVLLKIIQGDKTAFHLWKGRILCKCPKTVSDSVREVRGNEHQLYKSLIPEDIESVSLQILMHRLYMYN